jgi:hypothetical protein
MKLIRGCLLLLAVCLPTSWTMARVAHADEMGAGGSGGEMKKKHKGKKKDAGGAGGAKGEMEKK